MLPSRRYGVHVDPSAFKHELDPLDPAAVVQRQENQIGVNRAVGASSEERGLRVVNPDGTKIRFMAIGSPGAFGLRVHFENFDVAEEDEVYVYGLSADTPVAGPYSGRGPFGDGRFWTETIEGDTVVIEHLIRGGEKNLFVSEVSHLYGEVQGVSFEPQALSCEVDASCFSDPVKDAVGRIVFISGGGAFVCSGTMLNNRAQDFTPFFLTAAHCVSTEDEARTVQAYWFYQSSSCNSGVLRSDWASTRSGASLLAASTASDSSLLRIQGTIPPGVVFSGWDASPRSFGAPVYGLHHPGGFVPPSVDSFLRRAGGQIAGLSEVCPPSGLVNGYLADWATGTAERGSSGSGLFDAGTNELIGVLSCGPSPASCSTTFNLYGKFSDFYPFIQTYLEQGGGCVSSIAPSALGFAANGGTGSVNVMAPPGCDWTAVSNASWISITQGSAGVGAGTVSYTVATNESTVSRTGTVTVQGRTHTVNQEGANCTYTISPASRSFTINGGSGVISVTTLGECGWTVGTDAGWITITSPTSGSGNGTIDYTVAANPGPNPRTGTINVQGQLHTVNQAGINCAYSVSPTSRFLTSVGGTGIINITAPAGCLWAAVSDASWITITAAGPGVGIGDVLYAVAPNTGPGVRVGTISVADKVLTITQAGTGPLITGAMVDGKKLIVMGLNFGMGARVYLNGEKQKKTFNDPGNPTMTLIAKKSGKKIDSGQMVDLEIRNQDGGVSPVFKFTRP